MSAGGWIKLHRQALDNGWLRNPVLWSFWCYCLLKATHTVSSVTVGYQRVALEPGQFVFGRKQAAADLGITENVVRTCLTRLISTGNITSETTNKFSVITVVNWISYQTEGSGHHQQNNQQHHQEATSKSPTSHHIQEVKKGKKREIPFLPPSESEVREYMLEIGFNGDSGKFVDFYASKGWMVGKNKMKDWRAAVRTWKRSDTSAPLPQHDRRLTQEQLRDLI